MQLTSASGSRGNGKRGHFKVLQRLSGILRIEKQPRSTVKVSPYPNRCDTTPLVSHARALVYSPTPLPLWISSLTSLPLPPLTGKSCFCQNPAALSTRVARLCLSLTPTHMLAYSLLCAHVLMHGEHIFLLSKLILLCFIPFSLSHTPFGQWAYCLWQFSIHAEPLPELSEHCLLHTAADRI